MGVENEKRRSRVDLEELFIVLGLGMVFVGIDRRFGIELALIVCGGVIFLVGFLKVLIVIRGQRSEVRKQK